MKRIIYLLAISLIAISCGTKTKKETTNQTKTTETSTTISAVDQNKSDHIEILYFHGAKRCVTCRAVETHTKALLDSVYAKQIAKGEIVYKVIDISKKENEAIANKYEVTWSTLLINDWKDGKEAVKDMTRFSFSTARTTPQKFYEGMESVINAGLK